MTLQPAGQPSDCITSESGKRLLAIKRYWICFPNISTSFTWYQRISTSTHHTSHLCLYACMPSPEGSHLHISELTGSLGHNLARSLGHKPNWYDPWRPGTVSIRKKNLGKSLPTKSSRKHRSKNPSRITGGFSTFRYVSYQIGATTDTNDVTSWHPLKARHHPWLDIANPKSSFMLQDCRFVAEKQQARYC